LQTALEWSGKERVETVWSSWSEHFEEAAVSWHTESLSNLNEVEMN
jgi:hypothetical protein